MTLQILPNPTDMVITVGDYRADGPDLFPRHELDVSVKKPACGAAPWEKGPKAVHEFYCERLGPKFNRRWYAANYWFWVGNRMSERTANLLRRPRRFWRYYDDYLVQRANEVIGLVHEAERDGLFNLIPLIVTFQMSPHAIQQHVGRGAWRRAANFSATRNRLLMHAMRTRHDAMTPDPSRFEKLIGLPSGVLPFVTLLDADEMMAARVCTRPDLMRYMRVVHLIRDTRRMMGDGFNDAWGFRRLVREHDDATRRVMVRKYSADAFDDEWAWAADGFTAKLLVSPLDIAHEGETQQHCVASYANMAKQKTYAVFRIDGKERATLGVSLRPSPQIDQVYGAFNTQVSDECRQFCRAALHRFSMRHVSQQVAA